MDAIEDDLEKMDLLDIYKLYRTTMQNPNRENVAKINMLMREKFHKHHDYEVFAKKLMRDIDTIHNSTKLDNLLDFFNQLQTGDIVEQGIGPAHINCGYGASCKRENPFHKVTSHGHHWTAPIIEKLNQKQKKTHSNGGKRTKRNKRSKKTKRIKKTRKIKRKSRST